MSGYDVLTLVILLLVIAALVAYLFRFQNDVLNEYRAEAGRREERHVAELKRFAVMQQTGMPEIPDAIHVPAPDDANARAVAEANREAAERWVQNGIASLRQNYIDEQIPVPSEEELRRQVTNMLNGKSPL